MNIKLSHLVSFGLGTGAFALYHNAKAVAKQNTPFRRQWERHLLSTLQALELRAHTGEPMPLVYVALGDSAAQGLGASRFEEGYVPRVAAGLKAATGRDVALLNLSLSGGVAASVLGTQLPQLEGLRVAGKQLMPDVVTLDIGGNDVGVAELSPEEFGGQMSAIADRIPKPAFIADIPTFKPLRSEKRASEMSRHIERSAQTDQISLIRLEELSNSLTTYEYISRYHAGDMFHPNSPWYHLWSQLFVNSIADGLGFESVDMAHVPEWEPWLG